MSEDVWVWIPLSEQKRNKLIVQNREDFEDYVAKNGIEPDKAYIDIYSGPNGQPVVKEHFDNVISLDFDDFPADIVFKGNSYHPNNPTITMDQAKELVDFIEKYRGRDFVIHCDAGVSRSQQVGRYIQSIDPYGYEYDEKESSHCQHFFGTVVLSRLLEVHERWYPRFNINFGQGFTYNDTERRWHEN